MDVGRHGQKESEFHGSWIPKTPSKPILTKPPPIYEDRQENELNETNWSESEEFPPGFAPEPQANACFDSATCSEVNRGSNNREAALAGEIGIASDNAETGREFPLDAMAELNDDPFADLIALANEASLASAGSASQRNDGAANGSSINISFSNHKESSSARDLSANHDFSFGPSLWSNGNCTPQKPQYELPIPHQHSYDLNWPPGTMGDAISHNIISEFAPITPDKATRVESKQVSEMQSLCEDENAKQETERRDNEFATTRIDSDEPHCNEKLPNPVMDLSFAAVSTTITENHNPDKGGSHDIDLNTTPQQKPRRRKHRPKVITEGKPRKRTPKAVTPKPAGSEKNPTGKRKYVRKKGLNKDATPPAEATGPSADPETLEPNKKSCRRALNFDVEAQPRDESSTHKLNANLDSESLAQNICTEGTQSKSTLQLPNGFEMRVEKTQAGITYDLTSSVNQMLRDYISLPESQAPSTPLPTKTTRPRRKRNVHSQNENNTKGQVAAHNGQEYAAQIMVNTQLSQSPNDSNCSTSTILTEDGLARESKRKYSNTLEQVDNSSTNLIGIHYNNLQAYQALSWMHFPNICKKKRSEKAQNSTSSSSSSMTAAKNTVPLETCPQNDTESNPCLKANYWISAPQSNTNVVPAAVGEAGRSLQDRVQTFARMLALNQDMQKKKRSRGATRVRNLASLNRIDTTYPGRQAPAESDRQGVGNSHRPHTGIEALVAKMQSTLARKKRTKKRNGIVNSAASNTNKVQMHQKIVLYNHHQFSANSSGAPPEVIWKQMFSIDGIVEQLKHLDINRESSHIAYLEQSALVPYNMGNQGQNAIVLYRRDGTVVPYEGLFDPVKKRRPRPKVDLDEETTRVWKLLLGNINSEGIDGTDEEKVKWWEEERRVFRGRADSFIARMHLVQGDRRFSQWKGSVLDSVVGVFLTQNVSDHLSSSAFMSLAAHFPLKSNSCHISCHKEGASSVIDVPVVYLLDPEDTIKWNEKMSNQPVCDQSSVTLNDTEHNEEIEVVNSNECFGSSAGIGSSIKKSHCKLNSSESGLEIYYDSTVNRSTMEITGTGVECFTGDRRATNDVFSSQNSVISSLNTVDSSIAQTAEKTGSWSESNSEAEGLSNGPKLNSFNGSTSFMELLQLVGSPMLREVYVHGNSNVSSYENSKNERTWFRTVEYDNQMQNIDNLDGPKTSLGVSISPSNDCHSHLNPNSGELGVECFKMFREETKYYDISKNNYENSVTEQSALTTESASQNTDQINPIVNVLDSLKSSSEKNHLSKNIQEDENTGLLGNSRIVMESQAQQHHLIFPNHSGGTLDVTESTSAIDNEKNIQQKTPESDLNENGYSFSEELNGKKAATLKPKGRRIGKEKKDDIDWDSLRKQAETNGRKRERAPNTMDSLDWEAVRCADVNEIADTIKERGMNNMLAERIKDFLNRLVRDHGSIDLEWLRDVPPDKAKEYLLSIRGLGLKSVECVRLLTLHHLAFPVDTNVGRIAVRLGWVPLQPLPESLQLHLLELYPVLESIQKYLWPRLCKLDQRTLYELHYQMITFGKVFCTKNKPNCNACPMRGECRHFASAFASARLALPGPEEKRIVQSNENRTSDESPALINCEQPLPLPQATKQSEGNLQLEAKSGVNNCEPIIEEPASPEPECTQASEYDIEDAFCDDPDEIPTIKLNMEEFTQNLQNYMQNNMELQEGDMSKALVALTAEAASIPTPKLKNVSRLRTEHQVYELPDSHPLLTGLDKREPDDPCSYLLAIWTPGETANSIQPPEGACSSQEHGELCDDKTCFSCNSIREAKSQIVRGTLLIPCRTAMRGSFPLNGTYFQVNEVFADHDSSLNPMDVPRDWIWNLPRRTVYFGTSIPSIFKGLTTEGIQHCFWRGFVCVRGFDQKTRAPRPLMARLHFPASKLGRTKGKMDADDK